MKEKQLPTAWPTPQTELGCTQWHHLTARLAARTSAIRLPSATWRPCHPHRCWTSTGCKHMRASPVPLRSACWRKRTVWSVVQREQQSLRKESQPERPGVASDGEGGHPAALKEPPGLFRTDGKRPDGVTPLKWKQGKCVTWDITVSDTLAQSYVHGTSQTPCAAAEAAAERKTNK